MFLLNDVYMVVISGEREVKVNFSLTCKVLSMEGIRPLAAVSVSI